MKTEITKDLLLAGGWVELNETPRIFYMEKPIENRNPINSDPDDTDIKLVIHGLYNQQTFAVIFPNGAMLNFVANSMEELNHFENSIWFYDCEY